MDVQALRAELLQTLQLEFNSTIDTLSQTVTNLQAELASLRINTRPKPVLPDVDKFDGTSYKWDTWRPMIKAKLRVDGRALGDLTAQFYYVYFALDSKVQAMVLPQLARAEEDDEWNPQSIFDQLARVFDNPNKIYEAEDRLHRIERNSSVFSMKPKVTTGPIIVRSLPSDSV